MIDVKAMDVKEQTALVCLFYAMLPSKDRRYQDYSSAITTMAQRSGIKVSTIRNHKDAFDALFDNGRKGWHQDPLEKRNAYLAEIHQKYVSCSLAEIEQAVIAILSGEAEKQDLFETVQEGDSMDFHGAFKIIEGILAKTGSSITENDYDGLMVKLLSASNTLDVDRGATKQTHIAITGAQIDMFPYLRADGYFEPQYAEMDGDLKKYYIPTVAVRLDSKNISYLANGLDTEIDFGSNGTKESKMSILRSRRKDSSDQIELGHPTYSSKDFVSFRKLIHTGDYLVLLKRKAQLAFDGFGISCAKSKDLTNDLAQLNSKFFKLATSTVVDVQEFAATTDVKSEAAPAFETRSSKIHPLNCILYGAPGTGKTYATAEYALAIIENREVDEAPKTAEERKAVMEKYRTHITDGKIVFTTFHQSYGYEDFIQGLRPVTTDGVMEFLPVDGVFKRIVTTAMNHPEENFVIIIDEINRANISKVFGELITLIEDDKRWGEVNALQVVLPSGDPFTVPNNLYIVGTMNSADKSISLIDTALRRRFEFIEVVPNATLIADPVLCSVLEKLNASLVKELDSTDLLVGHAYFIGKTEADLCGIFNRSIIPLLYEYFYDNSTKVKAQIKSALPNDQYEILGGTVGRITVVKK